MTERVTNVGQMIETPHRKELGNTKYQKATYTVSKTETDHIKSNEINTLK